MTTTLHLPVTLPDLLQAIGALSPAEQHQILHHLQIQAALAEIKTQLNLDSPHPSMLQIHSITTQDGTPWAVLSLPALQHFTQIPLSDDSPPVPSSLPQQSAADLLAVLTTVKQEMLAERIAQDQAEPDFVQVLSHESES